MGPITEHVQYNRTWQHFSLTGLLCQWHASLTLGSKIPVILSQQLVALWIYLFDISLNPTIQSKNVCKLRLLFQNEYWPFLILIYSPIWELRCLYHTSEQDNPLYLHEWLNRFSWNLVKGCSYGKWRTCWFLERIQINEQIQEFFKILFNMQNWPLVLAVWRYALSRNPY